jgi:transcriptional regulator with XRE-family HTH domain
MIEIKEEFKYRFEKALAEKQWKAVDISRATGISEATISQYRSGYSKPKDKRLVLLANKLGVNPSWLMGLDVPMHMDIENEIAYQRYVAEGERQDAAALDRLLSPDEQEVLFAYRESPGPVKQVIRRALGLKEAESSTGSSKVG